MANTSIKCPRCQTILDASELEFMYCSTCDWNDEEEKQLRKEDDNEEQINAISS
jgi:Zn finger protein HypA/HybF involved in hydrogenase expression